jgi:hypothetical protein
MSEEKDALLKEISHWERQMEMATDTGIRRWVAYHLVLLRKKLDDLRGVED